jgi:hypothetical protein
MPYMAPFAPLGPSVVWHRGVFCNFVTYAVLTSFHPNHSLLPAYLADLEETFETNQLR